MMALMEAFYFTWPLWAFLITLLLAMVLVDGSQ